MIERAINRIKNDCLNDEV